MMPVGCDEREVWLLVLQHLLRSGFAQVARQLQHEVETRDLLPRLPDAPGALARIALLFVIICSSHNVNFLSFAGRRGA